MRWSLVCHFWTIFSVSQGALSCWKRPLPWKHMLGLQQRSGTCISNFHINASIQVSLQIISLCITLSPPACLPYILMSFPIAPLSRCLHSAGSAWALWPVCSHAAPYTACCHPLCILKLFCQHFFPIFFICAIGVLLAMPIKETDFLLAANVSPSLASVTDFSLHGFNAVPLRSTFTHWDKKFKRMFLSFFMFLHE